MKRAGSGAGSVSQNPDTHPDPYQNVMGPEHWYPIYQYSLNVYFRPGTVQSGRVVVSAEEFAGSQSCAQQQIHSK
jgi:hypothetical protein